MNIREAIAAGELDDATPIETNVGEVSDYGRSCNQAGYTNGMQAGIRQGIVIGGASVIAGVVTGIVVSIVNDIREENRKKRK